MPPPPVPDRPWWIATGVLGLVNAALIAITLFATVGVFWIGYTVAASDQSEDDFVDGVSGVFGAVLAVECLVIVVSAVAGVLALCRRSTGAVLTFVVALAQIGVAVFVSIQTRSGGVLSASPIPVSVAMIATLIVALVIRHRHPATVR